MSGSFSFYLGHNYLGRSVSLNNFNGQFPIQSFHSVSKLQVLNLQRFGFGYFPLQGLLRTQGDAFVTGQLFQSLSDTCTASEMKLSARLVEPVQLIGSERHFPGRTKFLHLIHFA